MTLIRWFLLAIATALLAALLAVYHSGKMSAFLRQEDVYTPEMQSLSGAQAQRAIHEAQTLSPQDISSTKPIHVSVAHMPLSQFAVEPDKGGWPSPHEGDAEEHMVKKSAKGAKLVRFENSEVCEGQGRCLFGIFAQIEGQANDFAHPISLFHARTVQISSRETAGNPDLIVDYGPPLGKRRLVWTADSQFPIYDDAGPAQ